MVVVVGEDATIEGKANGMEAGFGEGGWYRFPLNWSTSFRCWTERRYKDVKGSVVLGEVLKTSPQLGVLGLPFVAKKN